MISAKSIETLLWDVFRYNIDTVYLTIIGFDKLLNLKGSCDSLGFINFSFIYAPPSQLYYKDGFDFSESIENKIPLEENDVNLIIFDNDLKCTQITSNFSNIQIPIPGINGLLLIPFDVKNIINITLPDKSIFNFWMTNISFEETIDSDISVPKDLLIKYFSKYQEKFDSKLVQIILQLLYKQPEELIDKLHYFEELAVLDRDYRNSNTNFIWGFYHQLNLRDEFAVEQFYDDYKYELSKIISFTFYNQLKVLIDELIDHCNDSKYFSEDDKNILKDYRKIGFVASSKPMIKVFKKINLFAGRKEVLVTGDPGTGKELVALALDKKSGVSGNFVPVNVAGESSKDIEIKLLGSRADVFTGVEEIQGAIEQAKNGTLFLDEIGDISLDLQKKLLRIIETKKISLPGDEGEIEVNFNLVSATNVDLDIAVENKNIRKDFMSRIDRTNSIIHLCPLNDRKADIPAISKYLFLKYMKGHYEDDFDKLCNVRENDFQYLKSLDWSKSNVRGIDGHIEAVSKTIKKLFPNINDVSNIHIQQAVENPEIESFDEGSFQILNNDEIRALTALVVVKQRKFVNGIKTAAIEANEKNIDRFGRILHTAIIKLGSTVEFDSKSLTDLILTLDETPDSEFYSQFLTYIEGRWPRIIKESKKKYPHLYFGKPNLDEMIKSLKKSKQL